MLIILLPAPSESVILLPAPESVRLLPAPESIRVGWPPLTQRANAAALNTNIETNVLIITALFFMLRGTSKSPFIYFLMLKKRQLWLYKIQ